LTTHVKFPKLFNVVLADAGTEIVLSGIQMPHEFGPGAVDAYLPP
jgi:hypothetical protein